MLQAAKNPDRVIKWLDSINQTNSKKQKHQINQINQTETIIELKHMK